MFDTTSTLKLPLFLMALGGVNPLKRGFLSSFSYAIGFIATVPLFFLSFLDYYLTPNTITNFAQKLEGNMTFGQVSIIKKIAVKMILIYKHIFNRNKKPKGRIKRFHPDLLQRRLSRSVEQNLRLQKI